MTNITNEIHIDSPKQKVWDILADLETVQHYDPGVTNAYYLSEAKEGIGAARHCDLLDGGYVKERITDWIPGEAIEMSVYEGTDIDMFENQDARFTLQDSGQGTDLNMELQYALTPDAPADAGEIEDMFKQIADGLLPGIKQYIETGLAAPTPPS